MKIDADHLTGVITQLLQALGAEEKEARLVAEILAQGSYNLSATATDGSTTSPFAENFAFQVIPPINWTDGFGDDQEMINLSRDDAVIRFPDSATYMWVSAHTDGPIARGDMMRGYSNPEVDALIEFTWKLPATERTNNTR